MLFMYMGDILYFTNIIPHVSILTFVFLLVVSLLCSFDISPEMGFIFFASFISLIFVFAASLFLGIQIFSYTSFAILCSILTVGVFIWLFSLISLSISLVS